MESWGIFKYEIHSCQVVVVPLSIWEAEAGRFEVGLVYKVSSWTARALEKLVLIVPNFWKAEDHK